MKNLLSSIMIGLASLNSALAHNLQDAVEDFTLCDGKFFRTLKNSEVEWSMHVSLENSEKFAGLKVPDRRDPVKNTIRFSKPVQIAGLNFIGYFDEFSDFGIAGKIYSWGFLVDGELEGVVSKLNPLIHDNSRLRKDGDVYARTEVRLPSQAEWTIRNVPSGVAAGNFRTERVLLIEASDEGSRSVRFGCSLQGRVEAGILGEVRPDIAAE